jgi:hypothetical protein
MVLHGVALVNGTPVPKGTVLTLSVDGQPVQTSLQEDFGQAHYSVAIPPTPVQPIRFTSLGENSLAALSTVGWQAGTVLRHDILVNCELAVPPRILGAIARLADDTWTLDCPPAQDHGTNHAGGQHGGAEQQADLIAHVRSINIEHARKVWRHHRKNRWLTFCRQIYS